MANAQATMAHSNDDVRCDRHEPQPQGLIQPKMELISSKRGATWDAIFEILFPGAPVPSLCMHFFQF